MLKDTLFLRAAYILTEFKKIDASRQGQCAVEVKNYEPEHLFLLYFNYHVVKLFHSHSRQGVE